MNSPIGIFDSGMGGLSVLKEIVRLLPHESVIYYGDGKNCPYGSKSKEEVTAISEEIVEFLINKGAKLIVVACNTATADAIDHLREKYDIPFVGMEPAVKPAAQGSQTKVIGIIATEGTLKGRHFRESYNRYSKEVEIIHRIGEGFVELVENDKEDSLEALDVVRESVEPMIEAGADHIVLGCTHYPFLWDAIEKAIDGLDIKIVDPAPAVAQRVKELLDKNSLSASYYHQPEYDFYTSSDENYLAKLIRKSKK